MAILSKGERLEKELTLFDVFALNTAMISVGFFLLPGLAAVEAGPAVILAYLLAGIMVLPAMLSAAELSTAMPRSGGPYYFLDRSMGPLIGTVGGLGTWFALIFKSAFALIGMGAYLSLFMDVPVKPIAVSFAVLFMLLNMFDVKKTGQLQGVLIATLLGILVFFIATGFFELFSMDMGAITAEHFKPFLPTGFEGLMSTVGLIFFSFAGLIKVASVSEEIKDPERNIPLGMILSLASVTLLYILGVYVMMSVLEPSAFIGDYTPVASAATIFLDWMPYSSGLILIVIAAVAAFASTGNAGLMSAARYPFAMARDKLLWKPLSVLNSSGTPMTSIILTTGLMAFFIIALDVADIAKLASAFMLLIFGFMNVAVIIMRESKIEEYDPGFKSPLYPWVQILGIIISIWLIIVMGWLPIFFTVGTVILCIIFYFNYGVGKTDRQGAIYHVYERLGRMRYDGLEREMRGIMREKGLRKEDPYEEAVGRSLVLDLDGEGLTYDKIVQKVSEGLSEKISLKSSKLKEALSEKSFEKAIQISKNVALKHMRVEADCKSEIAIVRFKNGIQIAEHQFEETEDMEKGKDVTLYALIFLVSSSHRSGQHLRMLAHLAEMIDTSDFIPRWLHAKDETELREILLRDERFINILIQKGEMSESMIGKRVKDLELPGESLITLIKREDKVIFPHGNTLLKEHDELSIIGEKQDIEELGKFK